MYSRDREMKVEGGPEIKAGVDQEKQRQTKTQRHSMGWGSEQGLGVQILKIK